MEYLEFSYTDEKMLQFQPKYPSKGEWITKLYYLSMMKYYSVLKRNEILLIYSTKSHNYAEGKKLYQKMYLLYGFIRQNTRKHKLIYHDRKHMSSLGM